MNQSKQKGGRKNMKVKKIQKIKRKPTEWNKFSMKVYKEMKAKNPNVKFSEALKKAGKTYKKNK